MSTVVPASSNLRRLWSAGNSALLAAVFAGALLRCLNLDRKLIWFNEVFTMILVGANDEHRPINPALYTGRPVAPDALSFFFLPRSGSNLLDIWRLMLAKDPQQSPLYFALLRLWISLFGSEPAATRSLTVLFGLLAIPAIGLLCWELFRDRFAVAMGMALLAVSPIFVRYSQETRSYMLMILLLILAHYALLRALRLQTRRAFLPYAALLALGMLAHGTAAIAFSAHALYLLLQPQYRNKLVLRLYFGAALLAVLATAPWFLLSLRNIRTILATTAYLGQHISPDTLILRILGHIGHLLFSWDVAADAFFLWLAPLVAGLVFYALYRLRREQATRIWCFVVTALAVPILVLVGPDLLRGGRASLNDNYLLVAYLAALLPLAYLFSRPGFWRRAAPALLLVSSISSLSAVQADDWWGLSRVDLDVLAIMNADGPDLLITQVPFGVVAPLANQLAVENRLILTRENSLPAIPDGFKHVYVYQPSPDFIAGLLATPGVTLSKIYEQPRRDEIVYTLYELHQEVR